MKKHLCEITGKRKFPTRVHAEIRLRDVEKRAAHPLYSYQCEHCGQWHFTKKFDFVKLIELHL